MKKVGKIIIFDVIKALLSLSNVSTRVIRVKIPRMVKCR